MSAQRKRTTGMAENQVMDLWEAGMSMAQIAEQTGKTHSAVARIVHYMGGHEAFGEGQAAIRLGSILLAKAIQEVGAHA